MKRVGNITYELAEEEFNQIKSYLNDLNWAIEYDNKSDAAELIEKLEELFRSH